MDAERPREIPDFTLEKLGKQDLDSLSVSDLAERIDSLRIEIARCENALAARDSTKAAAEKLFKF